LEYHCGTSSRKRLCKDDWITNAKDGKKHVQLEHIYASEQLVAIIMTRDHNLPTTGFITTSDLSLQVGLIKYPAGGVIQPHVHRPLARHLVGTGEVLFVHSGKVEALLLVSSDKTSFQRKSDFARESFFGIVGLSGDLRRNDALTYEA
jgi:hypothetical protein